MPKFLFQTTFTLRAVEVIQAFWTTAKVVVPERACVQREFTNNAIQARSRNNTEALWNLWYSIMMWTPGGGEGVTATGPWNRIGNVRRCEKLENGEWTRR